MYLGSVCHNTHVEAEEDLWDLTSTYGFCGCNLSLQAGWMVPGWRPTIPIGWVNHLVNGLPLKKEGLPLGRQAQTKPCYRDRWTNYPFSGILYC